MVRFVRDFILKGRDTEIFQTIRNGLPSFMEQKGGYEIQKEIKEGDRLYRKSSIQRDATASLIPKLIQEKIPKQLMDTVTNLIEEQIFYEKILKIQWSIIPHADPIYILSGSIRFISLDADICKVMILIHLEWNDIDKYIPNMTMRDMILPLLENKIPEICVAELKHTYSDILSQEKK